MTQMIRGAFRARADPCYHELELGRRSGAEFERRGARHDPRRYAAALPPHRDRVVERQPDRPAVSFVMLYPVVVDGQTVIPAGDRCSGARRSALANFDYTPYCSCKLRSVLV